MRDGFINKCKEAGSKVLTLEFDYSQNYPITKLNVNNQFYKRMFWLVSTFMFLTMNLVTVINTLNVMV